jgi:hypothetical protein
MVCDVGVVKNEWVAGGQTRKVFFERDINEICQRSLRSTTDWRKSFMRHKTFALETRRS